MDEDNAVAAANIVVGQLHACNHSRGRRQCLAGNHHPGANAERSPTSRRLPGAMTEAPHFSRWNQPGCGRFRALALAGWHRNTMRGRLIEWHRPKTATTAATWRSFTIA